MRDSSPKVAIILLNWNGYNDSYECIKSLEYLDYNNFHVFLVDNASTDGSYEKLVQDNRLGKFNVEVTCIQSGGNLGSAGGNNVGINAAYELGYDYFWMLNNDTYVDNIALSALINVIDADQKIGIVGSKIYFADSKRLWFAGGEVNPYMGTSKHFGINEEDHGQYDDINEVDFIVGCSMLFRRELVEEIGLLEEDYFIYYEDTDWNVRAKRNGWKIIYVPQSIIYHKESSSTKADDLSPYYGYYLIRNGYLMASRMARNYKWMAMISLLIRIVKFHILYVLKSKNKRTRSNLIMKGAIHGIKQRTGPYVN